MAQAGKHLLPGEVTRITDQLFLIGHDEYQGVPRGNVEALNLALGAAVIAELLCEGFVTVGQEIGTVRLRNHDGVPSTGAGLDLLELIQREARIPLGDWMRFQAREDGVRLGIGQRLFREGIVGHRVRRIRLRRVETFPALRPAGSQFAMSRLGHLVGRPAGTVPADDVVVIALVEATRLSSYADRETVARIAVPDQWLATLPPPVHALISHTRAALGAAALRGY